jgi:hypothetical protein
MATMPPASGHDCDLVFQTSIHDLISNLVWQRYSRLTLTYISWLRCVRRTVQIDCCWRSRHTCRDIKLRLMQ